MACNLIDVRPVTSCKENLAGTGNKAYIARLTAEQRENILVSDEKPMAMLAFGFDAPVFHEVVLKSKVNKIDFQSNPNGGGYTATANLVVDKQVDSWAVNSRIMNNTGDWIILLSTGNADEYYLLGDANYDNEFSDAATTGDAPDSDKGSTVTVTAGPLKWPYLKVNGKLTEVDGDYTFEDTGTAPVYELKQNVDLQSSKVSGQFVKSGDFYSWDKDSSYSFYVRVEPGEALKVSSAEKYVVTFVRVNEPENNSSMSSNVVDQEEMPASLEGEYILNQSRGAHAFIQSSSGGIQSISVYKKKLAF